MKIEISFPCPECEGVGKTEHTTGGCTAAGPWMSYRESRCDHCDGTGEVIDVDYYESLADARLDYPLAKLSAS